MAETVKLTAVGNILLDGHIIEAGDDFDCPAELADALVEEGTAEKADGRRKRASADE